MFNYEKITKLKTPKGAATELHRQIKEAFPSDHVVLLDPEKAMNEGYGGGSSWAVVWEEGPYEWTLSTSEKLSTSEWYAEPYNSYILTFGKG